MFCKVCKDAKKSESVYTSHSVRVGGKVVCPTLLSQECKYCREKGHTPKHCPKLEGKYKSQGQQQQQQHQQQQQQQQRFQQRARELCSSPPQPAPAPAPIGKKTNYFQLLKVDEETDVTATLKDNNYLDMAKEHVESKKTKDAEIETYKKNLEKNFPALGEEKTMKIVDAIFSTTTTSQSYSSKAATRAPARARNEREDSPTPSPVSSCRSQSPPPAPKKMPQVKKDAKCYSSCPSPSPTPPPPTTTSWADME